jgi:hypothetical protein
MYSKQAGVAVVRHLHMYKSSLGPSNLDGSNTMDGSNLFESPANFPYIFKLKKIFQEMFFRFNSKTYSTIGTYNWWLYTRDDVD